nr:copia protein [Tanacetum cinerariifolium]
MGSQEQEGKRGIVVRNKARLVAQGHTQEEGIDYDEVFAPVARIEAIRLFLAYASFIGFTVYQIDIKSAFLYGTIDKEDRATITSPAVDEGSMQHNIFELMALCTSLQRQYSELQANFQAQKEEIVKLKDRVKVFEDREEEIARVWTSMDAAIVLAGGIDVPTGSGFIPPVGPPATVISTSSEVGPTASPIVTRRKGKEVMVESDTLKKKKLQEQIDAQVARELEEQQEKQNMRMNEQIARDA